MRNTITTTGNTVKSTLLSMVRYRRNSVLRGVLSLALVGAMVGSMGVTASAAGLKTASNTCGPTCPVCRSVELPAVASFSDVDPSSGFHDAIMACAELGIIGGYPDGTFRPVNPVSRSNFVVMLSRGFYADGVAANQAFEAIGGKFMPNYWTMYQAGVLEGTSFEHEYDLYNGDTMGQPINRYDMARLMTNIMDKQGFAASSSEKQAAVSKITDYSSIPSQYRDAVANVYALGVIGGYANGNFGGDITMNRGQAAAVINRMMKYAAPAETPEPEPPVETPVTPPEETDETWTGSGETTKPGTETDTETKPGTETGTETGTKPSEDETVCACCGKTDCPCGCTGAKTETKPETPVVPETPVEKPEVPEIPEVVDPTPVDPTPVDPTPVKPEIPEIPEVPETPETPVAGKTLANGKAITVENVSEILAQLKSRYPGGTDFSGGYAGLNSGRYARYNCIDSIVKQYKMPDGRNCSTTYACGGWAAFVADEIFGQKNVTWRQTTIDNVRPGDLLLDLDSNNRLTHVHICAGYSNGFTPNVQIQSTDAGGNPDVVVWAGHWTDGENIVVYTAYPD